MENLIGKQFNFFTVIDGPFKHSNSRKIYWKCRCQCGTEKEVRADGLKNGTTKSCGCYKKQVLIEQNKLKQVDLTNKIFGKLIALEPTDDRRDGRVVWKCECECGNEFYVDSHSLIQGKTTSCGCLISKGEFLIEKILKENKIPFEKQKIFSSCKFQDTGYYAKFDFYVNNNYLIEYDGQQHFYYANSEHTWNNAQNFEKTQQHDNYKNQWCKDNNIPLIRIPYTQLEQLSIIDLLLETSVFII